MFLKSRSAATGSTLNMCIKNTSGNTEKNLQVVHKKPPGEVPSLTGWCLSMCTLCTLPLAYVTLCARAERWLLGNIRMRTNLSF